MGATGSRRSVMTARAGGGAGWVRSSLGGVRAPACVVTVVRDEARLSVNLGKSSRSGRGVSADARGGVWDWDVSGAAAEPCAGAGVDELLLPCWALGAGAAWASGACAAVGGGELF